MGAKEQVNKRVSADSEAEEGDRGRTENPEKSSKGIVKQKTAGLGKTNPKYWELKVKKPTYTRGGIKHESRHYAARIGYKGQQHTFPLGTGNKAAAGKEAAKIYLFLLANGWETTREEFSPTYAPKSDKPVTVGEYIAKAETSTRVSEKTLVGYTRRFRRIVADIFGISPEVTRIRKRRILDPETGKKRLVEVEEKINCKHDYSSSSRKNGGSRDQWLDRVNRVRLDKITPEKIEKWVNDYVRTHGRKNPILEEKAKGTVNSILGDAKSLFGKKILATTRSLNLPDTLPFEGVALFEKDEIPSTRYESTINSEELFKKAVEELPGIDVEAYKIFLLGILCGLRRGEIDALLWENVDLERRKVHVRRTEFSGVKSRSSEGSVDISEEMKIILTGFKKSSTGVFVIESNRPPKYSRNYYYRAQKSYGLLIEWLKKNGVTARNPIHTLRKEAGTLVIKRFGLFAASRHLRHSDTRITSEVYGDLKEPTSTGLDAILAEGEPEEGKITPIEEGREEAV
ncbi:MAG: tyrosine-type recombinase/integrase [Verrucomicrobiales bacterium]|nr:tyrosine-type recombinase/integrase [Verrucomicrobiales bacterium]